MIQLYVGSMKFELGTKWINIQSETIPSPRKVSACKCSLLPPEFQVAWKPKVERCTKSDIQSDVVAFRSFVGFTFLIEKKERIGNGIRWNFSLENRTDNYILAEGIFERSIFGFHTTWNSLGTLCYFDHLMQFKPNWLSESVFLTYFCN